MQLKVLDQELSVCKVAEIPQAIYDTELYFIAQTDEELSLVCETNMAPTSAHEREDGWRAFRIEGVLDFSLVGILSKISGVLAEAKVGIFAISTFNTDYILVKAEQLNRALAALEIAGYRIV
ncbi:MAG: ACT domain-containing protein [Atopobiaceae bacterium]|nr:ACT domain-containing protein [Atopobiaceae bacterium]